jgi:hypothetical protein
VDRDGKKKVLTGLLAEGAAQALYVSIIYSPSLMVSFFGPLPTGMDPSIHSDVFARYERGALEIEYRVDDIRNFTHPSQGMKLRQLRGRNRRGTGWTE